MNTTNVYAPIEKFYRDDNGDFYVDGVATSPDLDLDQQVCDPTWLKSAMPEWFQFANVREQHSSIAAGVGTELTQEGDAWRLKSLVVDPTSVKKVEKGVLRGYSIGIKAPKVVKDAAAPGGRIVGGQIVEVSLVDRPCNPTCTLTLTKAAKPGMTLKAVDLDNERMLVKVEELHEEPAENEPPAVDARALVAARKAADPTIGKGSPQEDIAGARAAIAAIAALVVSEAEGLMSGDTGEACDIQELLCAIDSLRWYICGEGAEAEEQLADGGLVTIPLSASADTTKTTTPDAGVDDHRLTELVKTAVAEANQVSEERIKALETELAKVKALPAPGGPVLTRTAQDTAKAAETDALLIKAKAFRATADQLTDQNARRGYLELAEQCERQATSTKD